jgi:hypothetical protein
MHQGNKTHAKSHVFKVTTCMLGATFDTSLSRSEMVAIAFSPQAPRSATIVHDWAQRLFQKLINQPITKFLQNFMSYLLTTTFFNRRDYAVFVSPLARGGGRGIKQHQLAPNVKSSILPRKQCA